MPSSKTKTKAKDTGGNKTKQRTDYDDKEKELLVAFIAVHNPQVDGRTGMKLYEKLRKATITLPDGTKRREFPWSRTHTASSWNNQYKKNSDQYDEWIAQYQEENGIDPDGDSLIKRNNLGLGARNKKVREAEEGEERKAARIRATRKLVTRETSTSSAASSVTAGKRSRRESSTSAEARPSKRRVKAMVKDDSKDFKAQVDDIIDILSDEEPTHTQARTKTKARKVTPVRREIQDEFRAFSSDEEEYEY